MRFSQWPDRLRRQGLTPRHSYLIALLVTLLITIVVSCLPKMAKAESPKRVFYQEITEEIGCHLARMHIEGGGQNKWEIHRDVINEFFCLSFVLVVRIFKGLPSFVKLKKVPQEIDHIPITAAWSKVCLIKDFN